MKKLSAPCPMFQRISRSSASPSTRPSFPKGVTEAGTTPHNVLGFLIFTSMSAAGEGGNKARPPTPIAHSSFAIPWLSSRLIFLWLNMEKMMVATETTKKPMAMG